MKPAFAVAQAGRCDAGPAALTSTPPPSMPPSAACGPARRPRQARARRGSHGGKTDRPHVADPAIAELRGRVEALRTSRPPLLRRGPSADADTTRAAEGRDRDPARRPAVTDGSVSGQRTPSRKSGKPRARAAPANRRHWRQLRHGAIGIAARLSAALESGQPFAGDLGLLTALAQNDPGSPSWCGSSASRKPASPRGSLARRRRQGSPGRRPRRRFLRRTPARRSRPLCQLRRVGPMSAATRSRPLARAEPASMAAISPRRWNW